MMADIVICDWKEIDVRELAKITFVSRTASKLGATSVERVENYLNTMQERFPAEAVFLAHLEGKVVGWSGLERDSPTSGEISNNLTI